MTGSIREGMTVERPCQGPFRLYRKSLDTEHGAVCLTESALAGDSSVLVYGEATSQLQAVKAWLTVAGCQ
jgi:hypothetical protein